MINKRYDIVRVVTVSDVVEFHLKTTLLNLQKQFSLAVVGDDVEKLNGKYENVDFFNIKIKREISIFDDLKSVWQLYKFLKIAKPKIVHSIMPKAGLITALASFFAQVPFRMHTFTGQVWATKSGLMKIFLKNLDQLIVCLNTDCFTDSPSQSKFLLKEGIGHQGKALHVLGDGSLGGVDYEKFNPQIYQEFKNEFIKKFNIQNEYIFFYLGRKQKDKGVFDLLHAFQQIDQAKYKSRLLMVGPSEDSSYDSVVKKINSRVLERQLVIDVDRVSDPQKYFAVANVFCLCSYREGFGTVAIEAGAAGLPVLGTQIPGLIDSVVNGYTGKLVQVGDIDGIKKIMMEFMDYPQKAESMGQAGYMRVLEKFSSQKVYENLKLYYEFCLAKIDF